MADVANSIDVTAPPALPLPPKEYQQAKYDQINNVLRLFFTRVINNLRALLGTTDNGGRFLYFPRGSFYSDADQAIAIINTEQAVTFNNTVLSSGISVVTSTKITVDVDGVYTFLFSGQFDKSNASAGTVFVWYDKNGTGVTYSAEKYTLAGTDAEVSALLNFTVQLNATEYVEIMMAGDATTISLEAIPAAGAHPGVSSASLSVIYASNG
jgi:uncharacterized protein YcfL